MKEKAPALQRDLRLSCDQSVHPFLNKTTDHFVLRLDCISPAILFNAVEPILIHTGTDSSVLFRPACRGHIRILRWKNISAASGVSLIKPAQYTDKWRLDINRSSIAGKPRSKASAGTPVKRSFMMHTRPKVFTIVVAAICMAAAVLAAQQQPARNSAAIAAGEALFFGKAGCSGCHEVNGRGGVTGPDLSTAGTRSSEALTAKIRNPTVAPAPGGRGGSLTVVAKMRDGREIQGVRRNEDTFTLQIADAAGQVHLLDKSSLAEVRYESRSLMPADYASRLNTQELQNIVAYLGTLKERDSTRQQLPHSGRLVLRAAEQFGCGASELDALLGQLSRNPLFGIEANNERITSRACRHSGRSRFRAPPVSKRSRSSSTASCTPAASRERCWRSTPAAAADLAVHPATENKKS